MIAAAKVLALTQGAPGDSDQHHDFFTCLPKSVRVAYNGLTRLGGFNQQNLINFAESMADIKVDMRHEEQVMNVIKLITAVRNFGSRMDKITFFAHLKEANDELAGFYDIKKPRKAASIYSC